MQGLLRFIKDLIFTILWNLIVLGSFFVFYSFLKVGLFGKGEPILVRVFLIIFFGSLIVNAIKMTLRGEALGWTPWDDGGFSQGSSSYSSLDRWEGMGGSDDMDGY